MNFRFANWLEFSSFSTCFSKILYSGCNSGSYIHHFTYKTQNWKVQLIWTWGGQTKDLEKTEPIEHLFLMAQHWTKSLVVWWCFPAWIKDDRHSGYCLLFGLWETRLYLMHVKCSSLGYDETWDITKQAYWSTVQSTYFSKGQFLYPQPKSIQGWSLPL